MVMMKMRQKKMGVVLRVRKLREDEAQSRLVVTQTEVAEERSQMARCEKEMIRSFSKMEQLGGEGGATSDLRTYYDYIEKLRIDRGLSEIRMTQLGERLNVQREQVVHRSTERKAVETVLDTIADRQREADAQQEQKRLDDTAAQHHFRNQQRGKTE